MCRVRCTVEAIALVDVCLNETCVASRGRGVRCSGGYLEKGDAVTVVWRSALCLRNVQGAQEGLRLSRARNNNNNNNNNVYYIVADPGGRVVEGLGLRLLACWD